MAGPAVTIVDSGGLPVKQVDSGAPVLTAVDSGGVAVTLSDNGVPFVVTGGGGAPAIALSSTSIDEDATVGATVGAMSVNNGSGSYTFSITADPDTKFDISGSNLITEAALDYETATSHLVTIEADNGVDDPISRQFTITVNNVFEAATLGDLGGTFALDEDAAEDDVAGAITGKTTGSTLSLVDDAGGRVKLSGTNIVAGATALDYETATSHSFTVRETLADSSNSPKDNVLSLTVNDVDDTAPVLTSPSGTETSDTTADLAVTTDEGNGTLYWFVSASATPPSSTDLKAGTGAADSGSQAVSGTGEQTASATGLTAETTYYAHFLHTDAAGNDSAIVTSASFTTEATPVSTFNPADLFDASEQGAYFEPSPSTCFTDTARTSPASVGDAVAGMTDLSGNGNHATQATEASRPVLRQTVGGLYYLEFDGTDDFLATGNMDLSATDEITVIAGLRKLAGSPAGQLAGLSDSSGTSGSFFLWAPYTVDNYSWRPRGTSTRTADAAIAAPVTSVVTGQADISVSGSSVIRVDGAVEATNAGSLGTGNFSAAHPLYIGRVGGTASPFNGHLFALIVRGKTTSGVELTDAESYVAGKAGVTI